VGAGLLAKASPPISTSPRLTGKMPAMHTTPALPACCTALDSHWPLPTVLADTVLLSTHFDPARLLGDDFQRSAVLAPPSIQRSVAKRQAEFLAGRICARAALQQLEGLCIVPPIGEDRAPVWPAHICGSITHSTGRAAAIVANKQHWRGLGMDLENLLSHEFKALYPIVQQRFYFEHAEVLEWTEAGQVRLRLLTDLSSEWRNGSELEAQFGVQDGQLLSLVSIQA
jgi:enterobactin synthetase component D